MWRILQPIVNFFGRGGPGPRLIEYRVDEVPGCGSKAYEGSLHLLQSHLSPVQRDQYRQQLFFDVIGGDSGKRYRIRHGRVTNVDELDKRGERVCRLCFLPIGGLPLGDVLLAQKLALELFEREALKVAHRMWY